MSIIYENHTVQLPFSFSRSAWKQSRDGLRRNLIMLFKKERLNNKPAWAARHPDRTWSRHSAFLTCLNDQHRGG